MPKPLLALIAVFIVACLAVEHAIADAKDAPAAQRVEHPFILHDAKGWQDVRDKAQKYAWAKEAQADYVGRSEKWNVPTVRNPANPSKGDWLFVTAVENDLMAAGISYQLTLDRAHADKVRTFLLRLSDPTNGFPVTLRACNQASVQEGHFFQHIAMAYDATIPSGVYSEADRKQIDATLRLYCGTEANAAGNVSNWNVSALCGGLYCALILQDRTTAEKYLHAPGALIDQLRKGTLNDGWWYEVSISYNVWVATEFTQVALAMRRWGIELADKEFPIAERPTEQRVPEKTEYGITDARWGPINRNTVSIKQMWDVLPTMVDWRGVMFGLNDSTERRVGGEAMEIAYYVYRDPAYATVIKRGGDKRDLIYGVPELPEHTPDLSATSTFADNAGVAVLRSNPTNARERIQAVLQYGDHGWYHGHFDTGNLVHLSRYGRSFYNPEMIWYGYPSYLYKFYVQTSVSKNMVVVDQKMQEPAPNERILFHSGKLMQAAAIQVNTRWSNPPYGGIVYDPRKTFAEQALGEGRSIPIPENPPPYEKVGSITGYTEPILQRRLVVVTDDYVLLSDFLRGEQEHTYESLFQMKGFQTLESSEKRLIRHDAQWNPDPVGSAQFITDCDWYQLAAPARGSYQFRWGKDADNAGTRTEQNEPGVLNIDLHTLWPLRQEMMIGTPPEAHPVARVVDYSVRADQALLTEGKSGVWILGEVSIDVPLDNCKLLELQTQTNSSRPATLFWANGVMVTRSGEEIPLSRLPMTFDNAEQPAEKGKDFAGGPIKIAGVHCDNAVSANPQDPKRPAVVRVDLQGIQAVRFKCTLGGDFPIGDEQQRRKTVAVRSTGKSARFLTLIEPFEDRRAVEGAIADDADSIRVDLADGRRHQITIKNLDGSGNDVSVSMVETRANQITRQEAAQRFKPGPGNAP